MYTESLQIISKKAKLTQSIEGPLKQSQYDSVLYKINGIHKTLF